MGTLGGASPIVDSDGMGTLLGTLGRASPIVDGSSGFRKGIRVEVNVVVVIGGDAGGDAGGVRVVVGGALALA
jgi:hypothetical protein